MTDQQEQTFQEKVDKYNMSLIDRDMIDNPVTIIEYAHGFNQICREPIDLSFMNDLLNYVLSDKCEIPHTHLVKYGVLADHKLYLEIHQS